MSDPQDIAEALDADKIDDDADGLSDPVEGDYPPGGTDYPPDRPQGVDRMAMTPAEEAFPEPLGLRASREVPDPLAVELDRRADELEHEAPAGHGTLDDELSTEDDRLADDPELGDPGIGDDDVERLVATSPLLGDDEAALVAGEVDSLDDASAEEEAIHATADPPLRLGDSYLDDES
jgi:hypothetical protein